ncbi:MAG: flippase activity-associated protein Agl23, partial [Halobacteriota archaeon]
GSIVDAARRMVDYWVYSGSTDTPYLSYLGHYLETLRAGALVVGIFAVVGFLADHLDGRQPRALVLFATAWGVASVVGYPVAADIKAPWLTVHAVVPLAIPAAVGLGLAIRTAAESIRSEHWVDAALAGLVLVAAAGLILVPAYDQVYQHPTDDDNQLVQYAQPGGDWGDTIERMHELAEANDGVDVLYVGEEYFMMNESDADHKPAAGGWYDRLPLPWYTEQADAVTHSVTDPEDIEAAFEDDPPPVVITATEDSNLVDGYVDDYEHRRHLMRLWSVRVDVYLADT